MYNSTLQESALLWLIFLTVSLRGAAGISRLSYNFVSRSNPVAPLRLREARFTTALQGAARHLKREHFRRIGAARVRESFLASQLPMDKPLIPEPRSTRRAFAVPYAVYYERFFNVPGRLLICAVVC